MKEYLLQKKDMTGNKNKCRKELEQLEKKKKKEVDDEEEESKKSKQKRRQAKEYGKEKSEAKRSKTFLRNKKSMTRNSLFRNSLVRIFSGNCGRRKIYLGNRWESANGFILN